MTISNTARTAGPFAGNGVAKNFPFTYKVFNREDVLVAITDTSTAVETTLTLDADYTVAINTDQDTNPGGVITTTNPLPVGTTLAATSNIPITQTLDLTNQGGFYPKAISNALDRITIQLQQVAARVGLGLNVGGSAQITKILSFIDSVAGSTGSNAVGFIQSGAGAVPRTILTKLREAFGATDFGAKADGATDDTAAVTSALAAAPTLKSYAVTGFANPFGQHVTLGGIAEHKATKRVYNPSQHRYMQMFDVQVLQHWFSLFAQNSDTVNSGGGLVKKLMVSGDSVTFGYNNTTGVPANILTILAARRGYKNIQVINRGQSGKSTHEWVSDGFLAGDLALNPDLLILGWGDNDFGQGYTEAQLLAKYREALTTIRAAKDVTQLSIILRTPTTMTDVIHNRTAGRIERVIEGYKQLARDFQCAFIDVYSLCQNSHDGAGRWMDNDNGQAIHPLDVMQEHIWGIVADLALPNYGADWQNNGVYNYSAATVTHNDADAPFTYFDGITMARTGAGAPYDGIYWAMKQADSAFLELCTPLYGATNGYGIAARLGFNNGTGLWMGVLNSPALLNGGALSAAEQPASFYLTLEGAVVVQGAVTGGAYADGTTVFNLPNGFRPAKIAWGTVISDTGIGRVRIDTNGDVKVFGVAGTASVRFAVQFKN
jgi:lysophospholipase L1-like esterase